VWGEGVHGHKAIKDLNEKILDFHVDATKYVVALSLGRWGSYNLSVGFVILKSQT
jgi:hypothetical protein